MDSSSVALIRAGSGSDPVYGHNITNISHWVMGGDTSGMEGMREMDSDSLHICMSNSNYSQICHIQFDSVPPLVGEPAATCVFAAFDDLNGNMFGNWVPCGKTPAPTANTTSWVRLVNLCP